MHTSRTNSGTQRTTTKDGREYYDWQELNTLGERAEKLVIDFIENTEGVTAWKVDYHVFPYDIAVSSRKDLKVTKRVEVKASRGADRYPTFYAEFYNSNTKTPAEWVHAPIDYLIYVDMDNQVIYIYDAPMMQQWAKDNWSKATKAEHASSYGKAFRKKCSALISVHPTNNLPF